MKNKVPGKWIAHGFFRPPPQHTPYRSRHAKKCKIGYLADGTYVVFLAILMTALTVKVLAIMRHGVNVIPAIFIIPAINIITIGFVTYF